ncbi:MAG TPA: copper homeostasis protein CutC [Chitinophagaceae bacterium]|nr:copper homeostasis protein CutC [Chitinophagaceae bacterium]
MLLIEVIAFTIDSCTLIQKSGAARIELCANPAEGGTTPSYGMTRRAREITSIPVFPMIRPRGGDFFYSEEEYTVMRQDILMAKELHCDGIVLGLLQRNGQVDVERTKRLVELAYPMEVSFHRAFDRVKDPREALEAVISTGCTRLLTSGLQQTAWEGKDLIRKLIEQADERMIVMPGSGIRAHNIEALALHCGATEYHTSARSVSGTPLDYATSFVDEEDKHVTTNANEIQDIVAVLHKLDR